MPASTAPRPVRFTTTSTVSAGIIQLGGRPPPFVTTDSRFAAASRKASSWRNVRTHDPVRRVALPDQEIDGPRQRVVTAAVTDPWKGAADRLELSQELLAEVDPHGGVEKRQRLRG